MPWLTGFGLLALVGAALASLFVRDDSTVFEAGERSADAEICGGWPTSRTGSRRWSERRAAGDPTPVDVAAGERYHGTMDVVELLSRTTDSVTVGRVFGEPIERGGVTVIPVARVSGGAGGGDGTDAGDASSGSEGSGSGGGVGFMASPAGVFVISGDHVTWRPAVDVNRIVLGGQLLGLALVLTVRAALRRRAHR